MSTPQDSRKFSLPSQSEVPHNTNTRRLVTADELAVLFGVTTETIRHWARDGRIPCLRVGQKTIRFDRDAVLRAIQAKRGTGGGA